jgi:hypothetical protein
MVRHVVMDRPWHHLEKIAIERRREAVCGYSSGTGWMKVIHIDTCPQDLKKLLECMPTLRHTSLIRCQVAGDDVWRAWYQRSEVSAAA